MQTPKIKLLNTVKALNEKGVVDLTASERDQIDRETKDLIKNSKKKRAMKAPEGFEMIIDKLQSVEADEAFKIVTDFLAEKGLLESHGKAEDKADEVSSKMEDVMEKADHEDDESEEEEEDEHKEEKEDKKEDSKGFDKEIPMKSDDKGPVKDMGPSMPGKGPGMPGKGPEMMDKEIGKGPMGEGPKGPMKDKKDEMRGDLMKDLTDTKGLRDKVLAQAMELSSEEKKKRMLEMQEEEEGKTSEDMPSMGMEAKVKVIVTANKNILVVQGGKPLFHAVVKDEVKQNSEKLARLANKVSGWLVTEGISKTAKRCNATVINAGVDSDIDFGGQKLPEASEGVADGGEVDAAESHEGDVAETVQDGASSDTQERNEAKVARYTRISQSVSDVADGATDEIVDERPKREVEVTEGSDDDMVDEREEKEENVQEDAKFDFQAVEANYKKLYSNKARQLAAKAQDDFAQKFSRCLSIASQRMLKNLVYNPLKSASADVLMSANIQFSNGDRYAGMDEAAAVELTELIASEGHTRFLEALLNYTADLMDKEDGYLKDVESDLQNLAPVPVEVTASRKTANESMREEAIEGSIALQSKRAATGSQNISGKGVVSLALSGTKLGQRLSKF